MTIMDLFSLEILIPWILSMFLGVFVGGIPGLTATMAVALIAPISYYMNPLAGFAMVLGVSFTSIFAGDIPATLLKMPGTPSSGAAILDGYELAKQGKGGLALTIDLICSSLGGLVGVLALMLLAPFLANFALKFTHYEYFWLGIFGLSIAAILSKGNTIRGLISACLGLFISTIGMDATTGYPRFTFGSIELLGGIEFIPAMIGLFGFSEVLNIVSSKSELKHSGVKGKFKLPFKEALTIIWKNKWTFIKSSVIGTFIGALPGAGADIAAWVSYGVAKNSSKEPEKFGTGSMEGVIAPTSANNAALGGTWIPALVFGIPGDSITAIVLGIMLMYNLQPGPLVFQNNPEIIKGLFSIAIISQLLLIIVGYVGIKLFGIVLKLPQNIIAPIVTVFSFVGAYAIRNSVFDIVIMIIFGLIGYLLNKINVPTPPMILGIILGPMVENNLRIGLIKSNGSFLPFLARPISAILVIIIVVLYSAPYIFKLLSNSKKSIN
ncbi:MAG TPA: tripartite tricarboxylate transporter permease [Defluviitoga sp.]|nr:tripartite tricarboxylate transporter permease [Defluviitoga sp.]